VSGVIVTLSVTSPLRASAGGWAKTEQASSTSGSPAVQPCSTEMLTLFPPIDMSIDLKYDCSIFMSDGGVFFSRNARHKPVIDLRNGVTVKWRYNMIATD
jgi:hypothetical protein